MKQTAVEWFYQRILSKDIKAVFEQAKEMEKEQIEKTFKQAQECAVKADGVYFKYESFKQYYNETFKTNKMKQKEEPKQETLEDAAEKFATDCTLISDSAAFKGFTEGAKWQAERMYSEEEVEKIVRDAYTFGEKEFKHFGVFKEWFEQFKKK